MENLKIDGDLTVITPNTSVKNSNATVTGTTNIDDVAASTFTNKGTLNAVTITDDNGSSFDNKGTINGGFTVDTKTSKKESTVTINGVETNIKVKSDANLDVSKNDNATLVADEGTTVNDPDGKNIDTVTNEELALENIQELKGNSNSSDLTVEMLNDAGMDNVKDKYLTGRVSYQGILGYRDLNNFEDLQAIVDEVNNQNAVNEQAEKIDKSVFDGSKTKNVVKVAEEQVDKGYTVSIAANDNGAIVNKSGKVKKPKNGEATGNIVFEVKSEDTGATGQNEGFGIKVESDRSVTAIEAHGEPETK